MAITTVCTKCGESFSTSDDEKLRCDKCDGPLMSCATCGTRLDPQTFRCAKCDGTKKPSATPEQPIEITADPTVLRVVIADMIEKLNAGPKSPQVLSAITKLAEAAFWLDEI